MSAHVDAAVLEAITLHLAGRTLFLVAADRREQALGDARRRAIDLVALLDRLGVYRSRPMTPAERAQLRRQEAEPNEWVTLVLALRSGTIEARKVIDAALWELPEYRHRLADELAVIMEREHRRAHAGNPSEPD